MAWYIVGIVALSLCGQALLSLGHSVIAHKSDGGWASASGTVDRTAGCPNTDHPGSPSPAAVQHEPDGHDPSPCTICTRLDLAKSLITPAIVPLALLGPAEIGRAVAPAHAAPVLPVLARARPRGPPLG